MKHIRSHGAVVVLALQLLTLPCAVQAQFNYTTTNGTITITAYTGPGGDVTIPSTINGLPVTKIGYRAFAYAGLTTVTIPDSVSSIGESAFDCCNSLTNVTIPDSVTSIGYRAFAYCGFTTVTIPNSVTSIGDWVFYACPSLTSVSIPNSVTSIGYRAFAYCGLTTVTIPNSVTRIGDSAFDSCSGLTNITIPDSVTSIGSWAFDSCSGLTNITIPDSVTNMGGWVFYSCSSLTRLVLPRGITTIGEGAFYSCTSLRGVTIGSGVTSIGRSAFRYCASLTNVMVPSSVTTIGAAVFSSCTNLMGVYFMGDAPTLGESAFYGDDHSTVYYLPGTTGWGASFGGRPTVLWWERDFTCTTNSNGTITVTGYIGSGGAVTVPSTISGLPVTTIGDRAFDACLWLTSVTMPHSVTSIGRYAFANCASLTNITIPGNVTSIGDGAFSSCTNLTGVYFLGNAPAVGSQVFEGDNDATVYCWPRTTGWGLSFGERPTALWYWPVPDWSYTVNTNLTITITRYTGSDHAVSIPSAIYGLPVTRIGDGAFASCTSLIGLIIPDNVTSIGDGAFSSCTNLTGVYCNGNAPTVGSQIFEGANNAIVYYLGWTTGWGTTFGGRPTAFRNLPVAGSGSVVGWGRSPYEADAITVPANATNVVGMVAGHWNSMVLKSDGTVVAWGSQSNVPVGLSNVVAIAGGNGQNLALKSDGTVAAWGWNEPGPTTVPNGFSNVVAIAAESSRGLALKSDGTVVGLGYDNPFGPPPLPAGLSNVVAIAAGDHHSLVLKSDGTVVAWGGNDCGQATVPRGLSNVVAIAAGGGHSLALKSDGTVVAWGWPYPSRVPVGLSNVVAIAGGGNHSLALKNDGTVVAWGWNSDGQCTVPEWLSNVVAIAGGYGHTLALLASPAEVYGEFRYRANGGTITITKYTGVGGDVIIPGMINGLPVTCIAGDAFYQCTNVTGVTIPDSVTSIGDWAFIGCTSLKGAYFIGNAPGYVGRGVFVYDNSATVYYLPGTTGWGASYGGRPTALWHLPVADASATETLLLSANGVNATVVLNGSRSYDLDGDTLQYSWFSSSTQPPTLLATGVVAMVVLPVGSHAIDLLVTDGVATSTNSITVTVLTTSQAVQGLIALVDVSAVRNPKPLMATLSAAQASMDRGNRVSAINQLQAFQNKVHVQVGDDALARQFIDAAQQVIEALGGTGPGRSGQVRLVARPGAKGWFTFSLGPGRVPVIEASTNLVDWEVIGVAVDQSDGVFTFEDAAAARFPNRFYRLVIP